MQHRVEVLGLEREVAEGFKAIDVPVILLSARAGTEAGKPPGEATKGETDPGTGTEKKG